MIGTNKPIRRQSKRKYENFKFFSVAKYLDSFNCWRDNLMCHVSDYYLPTTIQNPNFRFTIFLFFIILTMTADGSLWLTPRYSLL